MTAFDPALTRAEALRSVRRAFAAGSVPAADTDARFLVLDALGLTRAAFVLAPARPIGPEGAARLAAAVRRRLAGEPVARIVGAWEFWGLPFALAPAALVPRPDTETVVEAALAWKPGGRGPHRLLDLGTGSGCILVALLSEWRETFGIGLDRSHEALACARANAVANGVGARAAFVGADWCAPLSGPFDLIVSNPPYVASATIACLAPEVRLHDPRAALDGGADGLAAYRRIVAQAAGVAGPALLAETGALIFEVGFDQAEAVARIGREAGFAEAGIRRDLGGHARVVTLTRRRPAERDGTIRAPDRGP